MSFRLPNRPTEPVLAVAIEWLGRLPARRLTAAALGLLALIALFDWFTPRDAAVAVGYLLPAFVAAAAGGRASTSIAALSALTWTGLEYLSRVQEYSHAWVPGWNLMARFAVLWLVGTLAGHLAGRLSEERDLSRTDALTGLPNARAFREAAEDEIDRMRHTGVPLTAAYVDVDGFKAMNDTNGHAAGDAVLAAVGGVLSRSLGPHDRVARLGGDEFAVLMPATGPDEARIRLGRLHDELLAATSGWTPRVGFSVGAVTCAEPPRSAAELVEHADRVMYEAKRHHRNTVQVRGATTRDGSGHHDRPAPQHL